MADLITRPSVTLRFTTDSKKYYAFVKGTNGTRKKIKNGDDLPTIETGKYVIIVVDREMREFSVTIEDIAENPLSIPPKAKDSGSEMVSMTYGVM